MPCRALEAFRLIRLQSVRCGRQSGVLMPCRALEAFRPRLKTARLRWSTLVLMPCRALEAFRLVTAIIGLAFLEQAS